MKIRIPLRSGVRYFDDPPASPPVVPPPPPPTGIQFTKEQQDHINKLMAEQKRTVVKENQELIKQLETIRDSANLTAQQKEELEARISTLSQQHLTEQQKLAAAAATWEKKYKTDTEALTGEARKWKGSYEKLLVTNAILEGSKSNNAASHKQMTDMLLPKAKVVEVVDDAGQPTGEFVAKVPVTIIDAKTKKPVTVELPIVEAIAEMRKDPDFANLFLVDGKPGFGGSNNGSGAGQGGTPDFSKMSSAEYAAWRTKNGMSSR